MAHMRAQSLPNPCRLGVRNVLHGDKIRKGPRVGTVATSPLQQRGSEDARDGKGQLATVPTRRPFLILSLCRALGTPETAVVTWPLCPHVGHF